MMVLALLLTPDIMSLVPGMEMTQSAADCCDHMGADCGRVPMPSSMLGCKAERRVDAMMTPGNELARPGAQAMPVEGGFDLTLSNSPGVPLVASTRPERIRLSHSPAILRI